MGWYTLSYDGDQEDEVVHSGGPLRISDNLGFSREVGEGGVVGVAYSDGEPEPKKGK